MSYDQGLHGGFLSGGFASGGGFFSTLGKLYDKGKDAVKFGLSHKDQILSYVDKARDLYDKGKDFYSKKTGKYLSGGSMLNVSDESLHQKRIDTLSYVRK